MFDPRRLNDSVSVAPQIAAGDMAAIKAAGFATVINNRPDGEEPDQPPAAAIRAAAATAGLGYHEIPVDHGGIGHPQLDAMAAALAEGPALAFCRSGTRSCHLWALTRAQAGEAPAPLIAQAAAAGYDLRPLALMLAKLGMRN